MFLIFRIVAVVPPSHTSALKLCAGLVMIGVIIASRRVGINPDNVATPIAASLGDLITLSLLAGISTGLYKELGRIHTLAVCLWCGEQFSISG